MIRGRIGNRTLFAQAVHAKLLCTLEAIQMLLRNPLFCVICRIPSAYFLPTILYAPVWLVTNNSAYSVLHFPLPFGT